jgi:hypothetical protein
MHKPLYRLSLVISDIATLSHVVDLVNKTNFPVIDYVSISVECQCFPSF